MLAKLEAISSQQVRFEIKMDQVIESHERFSVAITDHDRRIGFLESYRETHEKYSRERDIEHIREKLASKRVMWAILATVLIGVANIAAMVWRIFLLKG